MRFNEESGVYELDPSKKNIFDRELNENIFEQMLKIRLPQGDLIKRKDAPRFHSSQGKKTAMYSSGMASNIINFTVNYFGNGFKVTCNRVTENGESECAIISYNIIEFLNQYSGRAIDKLTKRKYPRRMNEDVEKEIAKDCGLSISTDGLYHKTGLVYSKVIEVMILLLIGVKPQALLVQMVLPLLWVMMKKSPHIV